MTQNNLIPREVLFGNPDRSSPQISPDGTRLAFLAPDQGVLNVWVGTFDATTAKAVTHDRDRGIRFYFWGYDNRTIFYLQDQAGNENWHLHRVDLATDADQDLTPFENVQVRLIDADKHFPDELLLAINKENPALHDAYHLDLKSGTLRRISKNNGHISSWIADASFRVRGAIATRSDGGQDLLVRDAEETEWRTFVGWSRQDSMTSGPVGFSADGKSMLLLDCRDRDLAVLTRAILDGGRSEVISGDAAYDVGGVTLHPDTRQVQCVTYQKDRAEQRFFDRDFEADFAVLRRLSDGDLFLQSRDANDVHWIVGFLRDDAPTAYYAYDRKSKQAQFLFVNREALSKYKLAKMRPIRVKTRDGLLLQGYATFPPGGSARSLPTVLNVHGGPWARDTWGYDPEAQWLANRGYLCLQINFRGSTGYGKKFVNAADKEWGGKMQDDLTDTVHWAVDAGYADPGKVVIYGGSYGGYASLAGATLTPDLYCAAIAVVGPSNLLTFIRTIPPYWEVYRDEFYERVGNPEREEEFLKSRSPLFRLDALRIPLLIAQGANDPRVNRAESEQIVEALRKKGLEHEYLLFEDEGHGFAKPKNKLKFYAAAETFLSRHLGGQRQD